MKYNFYAIFQYNYDGIDISFPDLPGCLTCAKSDEEALYMAKDALEGHLLCCEDDNDEIPTPSKFNDLVKNLQRNETLQLFCIDTNRARAVEESTIINKTVTLPKYLIELGKAKKINFSQLLKRALIDELNI
ncbi:MAG: type II toxin-antitoxin system HicB family antitoxin [Parvimonas sp.]|uniref:type II toxin-antitoxin system HicB family antitoxin n=1 Tax=Parvimonas sp. TaxID=1944660 RepID=UPI002A74DB84|nr:type II toxin-antitoxin system HicB family antitoxin [Parvimonas sp.]MDY3050825.1 type II toxin-antitoxin system HicB family antitoxin [Parvimonas sp.]